MKEYTYAKVHKPKTGDDWYIYYTFRNPETGVFEQFKERKGINRLQSVKEKKELGAILVAKLNKMLDDGWSPFVITAKFVKPLTSLDTVMDEMLTVKRGSVRIRSYQHYKFAVDLLKEYCLTKSVWLKPAYDFSPILAQGYSDYLITAKNYSGKSHNNQIANMKVLFNMMLDRELIAKNPFRGIKKKPEKEGRIVYYDKSLKKTIGDYFKRNDHPLYIFTQIIYYCFVRPNEIMQLQVKHLDLDNGNIIIPASASKNGKSGLTPVHNDLLPILRAKFESLDKELYLFSNNLKPGIKNLHRNRASEAHKMALRDLGISNDHVLYDWKHTGARDFIISGRNPYDLMRYMRHHSLDQTMVYLRSLGVSTEMKTDPKAWTY